MVLLTCDFDINPALMSSLANELIAARVQRAAEAAAASYSGGSGAVAVLHPRLSLSQSRRAART